MTHPCYDWLDVSGAYHLGFFFTEPGVPNVFTMFLINGYFSDTDRMLGKLDDR